MSSALFRLANGRALHSLVKKQNAFDLTKKGSTEEEEEVKEDLTSHHLLLNITKVVQGT